MRNNSFKKTACLFLVLGVSFGISCAHAANISDPLQDEAPAQGSASRTIVLAGGCFWGVEAVFQHVKGVEKAVSGYAGGNAESANYNMVSSGVTDHAESVEVTYNPQLVSLGQLLKVFFAAAHNPTEMDRQGPDTGTQYRSAIFFTTAEQEKIAQAYIAQLNQEKSFSDPVVTTVDALETFYPAEDYHQDYARLHPDEAYIVFNDLPKVAELKKNFHDLYKE